MGAIVSATRPQAKLGILPGTGRETFFETMYVIDAIRSSKLMEMRRTSPTIVLRITIGIISRRPLLANIAKLFQF